MRRFMMLPILGFLSVSLLLGACGEAVDQRRDVADRILGPAATNECRAVRATELVKVSIELWSDQKWEQAQQAAALMAESVSLPVDQFNVLSTNFAFQYYTPLVSLAVKSGVDLASSGPVAVASLLIEGMELLERIPNAALAVGRVRAAVAACAARAVVKA